MMKGTTSYMNMILAEDVAVPELRYSTTKSKGWLARIFKKAK